MSRSLQGLVRSQILFREVNERLRDAVQTHAELVEFVCECSNENCIETIPLEVDAYNEVRAHPNRFVVAPDHENLEVDRVIDQGEGYLLVEKIVHVDRVLAADPRSRT